MRGGGRTLDGHQVRPAVPASSSTASCASPLALSRSLAPALRVQSAAVVIGAPSSAPAVPPQCAILSLIPPSPSSAPHFAVAGHASERLVMHGEPPLALAFFSGETATTARVARVPLCLSAPPS